MILRVTFSRLFLFSLIIFSMTWLFHQHSIFNNAQNKPVHLLILTSWRSGSSFLGQIFNHHRDVFYLFEPARVVWVKFPYESANLLHYPIRDLLCSLFHCDMSPLHTYLPRRGSHISDLPFWTESWALCSPPACSAWETENDYDRPTCFQHCGNAPLEKMADSCNAHSHVVLKVVRILDLKVFLPLFEDPTLDFRVLHLVRDPRAVASSRSHFDALRQEDFIVNGGQQQKINEPSLTQVMDNICRAQVNINEVGTPLKKRYMVMRHEDLARDPLFYIKKIYDFAGLSLSMELESWVYNVTHRESPKQSGFMNFAGVSENIVQKWRETFNHSTVLTIQDKCRKAMEVFGYRPVRSMEEQKDLTLDLVIEKDRKS
ncbi:carbohydrate sulfotransferase 6-like [Discoglossus pictus]